MNKLPKVIKAIKTACSLAESTYDATREAAKLAAAQLDTNASLKARVDAVCTLYAEEFTNHNVRANFKAILLLLADKDAPISIETEKGELHITAGKAAQLAQGKMRLAAKEVREAHGIGRKAGGGRKPAEKPLPAVQPALLKMTNGAIADRVADKTGDALFQRELAEAMTERYGAKAAIAQLNAIIKLIK